MSNRDFSRNGVKPASVRRCLNQVAHPRRRSVLCAGTAGLFAAMMGQPSQGTTGSAFGFSGADTSSGIETISAEPGFGKARRCIMLFMWGGPSQLDTFDPKPNAPDEVRGDFGVINTATPGLQISEHFRRLAPLTDQIAVIRSMTHDDPAHLSSAHTTLTGHLPPVNKSDAEPPSRNDSPHMGAVLSRFRSPADGLSAAVTLPWKTLHPAAPGGESPGQTGGWLGQSSSPMLITGDPAAPGWTVPALRLLDGVDTSRLDQRRALLDSIERQQHFIDRMPTASAISEQQAQAFRLLGSSEVKQAFDLTAESDEVRRRYGMNTHGQCVLLGRRLLERGVSFVNVNWHNDGRNFWDTHGDNFNRLKNDLIPPADQALSALITDLRDRNLLDDTLIVWVGEFGRRPRINKANAGREHHPFCYSGLLAGGGIQGGAVYGRSDSIAMYPEENPVSPHDLAATMLHALGIPRDSTLSDNTGRPRFLYAGNPIMDLF